MQASSKFVLPPKSGLGDTSFIEEESLVVESGNGTVTTPTKVKLVTGDPCEASPSEEAKEARKPILSAEENETKVKSLAFSEPAS